MTHKCKTYSQPLGELWISKLNTRKAVRNALKTKITLQCLTLESGDVYILQTLHSLTLTYTSKVTFKSPFLQAEVGKFYEKKVFKK